MGMVVRSNVMALNAYRQLGLNNSAVSKSLEKLSSCLLYTSDVYKRQGVCIVDSDHDSAQDE